MRKLLQIALLCWISLFCISCGTEPAPLSPVTEPETQPTILEEVSEPPTTEALEEKMAVQLEDVQFLLEDADVTQKLSDHAYRTQVSFHTLTVKSSQPFSALYLIWDEAPGPYAVTWDGGSVECGDSQFLHEYVRLPEAVTSLSLRLSEDVRASICELQLYTEGTPPADVQQWLPPCEKADILVFPTHSDDDTLFFGAVISYYTIEENRRVQTAFMVDHWYENVRNHERLDGLWELGVRNYPIVGTARDYMSKSLAQTEAFHRKDDIPGWQVAQIRHFQPLVVIGHDLNGEYGHGQHKLNAHSLLQSVEAAADPTQHPESAQVYGVWDTPKLYLHLYPENQLLFDVNTPLENDDAGRTPFEIAQAAYACHTSQQKYNFRVSQSEEKLDCRRFGLYRTLVGQDTSADFLENTKHISR